MHDFTAHRLIFVTEAQDIVELNEHQGSALRGALFHALRHRFCAFARDPEMECARCALTATCPVATLVSTLDPAHARGQDRPRPFTVQPPILVGSVSRVACTEDETSERVGGPPLLQGASTDAPSPSASLPDLSFADSSFAHALFAQGFAGHYWDREDGSGVFRYEPREKLVFGLTLYANALQLFPYVVLALQAFEQGGLGRKCEQYDGRWRRGRIQVAEVWAENPLTGERQPVLRSGDRMVQVPDVPVTHDQIEQRAWELATASTLTLRFLTPTRIVEEGHLLKPHTFRFRPFFQRLLERLEALSGAFSRSPLAVDFPALLHAADAVEVVERALWWEDVSSYSTRRHAESPIGGLVGRVTLAAEDWRPFLSWLLWGQFTHVGKDAVKGNGWYAVE